MAGEIQLSTGIGSQTLYAVVTNSVNQFFNAATPGFEAFNAAHWISADYCIAMTEDGGSGASGFYAANFPAVAFGVYNISIRTQAGGSPAVTDAMAGSGQIQWSGTIEQPLYQAPVNLVQWLGVAPAVLSTNGYVQSMLLRWLTDNAAGTPAALSGTNQYVQAMVQRLLTDNAGGTPNALLSGRFDASVGAYQAGFNPAAFQKNVALNGFSFVMTDNSNHRPASGLTVSGRVTKDRGALGALTNPVREIGSGWYYVDIAAADVNCNTGGLEFTAVGADTLEIPFLTER